MAQDLEFREFQPFDEPADLSFTDFPEPEYADYPEIRDPEIDLDLQLPTYEDDPWTGYNALSQPVVTLPAYGEPGYRGYAPLTFAPQADYSPPDSWDFNEFLPFDPME